MEQDYPNRLGFFFLVTAHPEMFGSLLIDPDAGVTRIIILTSC